VTHRSREYEEGGFEARRYEQDFRDERMPSPRQLDSENARENFLHESLEY